jgi:hypothetical protein
MKSEYDFSKGERGKFYCRDAKLNVPVYLDEEVRNFIEQIAKKKHSDISAVVNDILRSDMRLADALG